MIEDWEEYLVKFEKDIFLDLYQNQDPIVITEPVPLRKGKLSKSPLADFVGNYFESHLILSFNYYGLFKLSTGIQKLQGQKATTVMAKSIHFSSIKIEHLQRYNKNLILDFVNFKKFLVSLRWNK